VRTVEPAEAAFSKAVLGLPGVVGAFKSSRNRDGEWLPEPTLSVHVRRKKSPRQLKASERLPSRIGTTGVDVLEVGVPHVDALDIYDRSGPIGDPLLRTGALTALARHDDYVYALGSGHVFLPYGPPFYFDFPLTHFPQSSVGIMADDPSAAAKPGELIAGNYGSGPLDWALLRFPGDVDAEPFHPAAAATPRLPVRATVPDADAAVFHLAPTRGFVKVRGVFRGQSTAQVWLKLSDRTTWVWYTDVLLVSWDQVAFSNSGDSGSLVVDGERRLIGTVLGSSPSARVSYLTTISALSNAVELWDVFFTW
jgi:hypothetical protein